MGGVFSSRDGNLPLSKLLSEGIGEDKDPHEEKTTVQFDWIKDFQWDLDNIQNKIWSRSRTENEEVLIDLAFRRAKDYLHGSGISWVIPINRLAMDTVRETRTRDSAEQILHRATGAITSLHIPSTNEVNFKMAIHKEDSKRVEERKGKLGIDKKQEAHLGMSILVMEYEEYFKTGTFDEAVKVVGSTDDQVVRILPMARSEMEAMGEVIGNGIYDEEVYKDDLEESINDMYNSCGACLEHFMRGVEMSEGSLNMAGIDVGKPQAEESGSEYYEAQNHGM